MTVIERHRRSYDVFPDVNRTHPFDSGATCFYNYSDPMIRNDGYTPKGKWTSNEQPSHVYEVYEKGTYHVSGVLGWIHKAQFIIQKKYDLNGFVVDDEFIAENHAIMTYPIFLSGHII